MKILITVMLAFTFFACQKAKVKTITNTITLRDSILNTTVLSSTPKNTTNYKANGEIETMSKYFKTGFRIDSLITYYGNGKILSKSIYNWISIYQMQLTNSANQTTSKSIYTYNTNYELIKIESYLNNVLQSYTIIER